MNDQSPVGKVGHESLEVLSKHIQAPLPNSEQLQQVLDYHDSIGAPQSRPARSARPAAAPVTDGRVREAIAICDEIIEKIADLPETEKAQEYGESLGRKAQDFKDSILRRNSVTEPMSQALERMLKGLNNWFKEC